MHFSAITVAVATLALARADCAPSYSLCAPAGASTTALPPIGTALASLYPDLLNAVRDIHAPATPKRAVAPVDPAPNTLAARDHPSLCCAAGSACILLPTFHVPLCYDRFTTNYRLPDGAFGALDAGTYRAPDGSVACLANGSFSAAPARTTGNLYGDGARAPDTATLPVPTPYTGTGVGGAIPATALGGRATYTLTLPATTVAPSSARGTLVPGTTRSAATTLVTTGAAGAGAGDSSAGAAAAAPTPGVGVAAAAGLAGVLLVVVVAW